MSGDLIDTTEMYLKTVFELEETGVAPLRARIAERLGHSGPTVSQTVARMERDGLLHLDPERHIRLTAEGSALATAVMRKHRLAERHLLDHLGLDYAQVHEEACRWEHVMSDEVARRIAARIDPPYRDPYGNPIPGLAEYGLPEESGAASGPPGVVTGATPEGKAHPMADAALEAAIPDGGSARVRVVRLGERLQSDPARLGELARHGVVPGAELTVDRTGGRYTLRADGSGRLAVSDDVAGQIRVVATDSA